MNISGPLSAQTIQRSEENSINLRMNQRIAAEVLQVSGDRVTLALNGVQVVARLSAPDQAMALIERRMAQFIVRDFSSNTLVLQLAPGSHPADPAPPPAADIIPDLLHMAGVPVNAETVRLAQALLQHGLPVTAEVLGSLQEALSALSDWDQADAQRAAALKASGLPLSSAALLLARHQSPGLQELMVRLAAQLRGLIAGKEHPAGKSTGEGSLPAGLAEQARQALSLLENLTIPGSMISGDQPGATSSSPQAQNSGGHNALEALGNLIRLVIGRLGKPVEADLGELPLGGRGSQRTEGPLGLTESPWQGDWEVGDWEVEHPILALAVLRRDLAKAGLRTGIDEIDQFIDRLRLMQFTNTRPEALPGKGGWLDIELPLSGFTPSDPTHPFHQARGGCTCRLRIARQDGNEPETIDAAHTRLILNLEIGPDESIQVDLTVADRRVGARVTTPGETLRRLAELELPEFERGLAAQGYTVQTAVCEVASPWERIKTIRETLFDAEQRTR